MPKRVTIREVAKCAGVSIGTVSFVLNDTKSQTISPATREKVLKAALKLGYVPDSAAKSLRSKKTMTLAVVSHIDIGQSTFTELLYGIYDACEERGYSVLLCPVRQNAYEYVHLYKTRRIDAVILICPVDSQLEFDFAKNEAFIRGEQIPAVFINAARDTVVPNIDFDYFTCSYLVTKRLIDGGNRNICYIAPEPDEFHNFPKQAQDRLNGYKTCMADFGLKEMGKNILTLKRFSDTIGTYDKAKPMAVVANKLSYAFEVYKLCLDYNIKIGRDISLVCANYDNVAACLYPGLVCAHLPFFQIGRRSAEVVLDFVDGIPPKLEGGFAPVLTEGESVVSGGTY